jgi:gluconokinase
MGMMADVLGRRVVALGEHEASSRGAALLALETLGLLPDIAAVPTTLGATYEPDAARHARYQEGIARQTRLYDVLVETSKTE